MSRSANAFGKLTLLLIASICTMQLSLVLFAPLDPSPRLAPDESSAAIGAIKAVCDDGFLRVERTRGRAFAFFALFFAAKAFLSRQKPLLSGFWQSILPSLSTWLASIGVLFESAPQSDMVLRN